MGSCCHCGNACQVAVSHFFLYDSDLESIFPKLLAMEEDDSDHILENDVLNQATTRNIQQKQNWNCVFRSSRSDRKQGSQKCQNIVCWELISRSKTNGPLGKKYAHWRRQFAKHHSQSLFHASYCLIFSFSFEGLFLLGGFFKSRLMWRPKRFKVYTMKSMNVWLPWKSGESNAEKRLVRCL